MAKKQDGKRRLLMHLITTKSVRHIALELQAGADVNNVIAVNGCMWQHTSPLRLAVSSRYVNSVLCLLDHGAVVDNHTEMWVNVISNIESTEIFRRLFATLKQQLHAQYPHLNDRELLAHVWEYLDGGSENHGHITKAIAIHGTPVMLSMALGYNMPVGIRVRPAMAPVIPPGGDMPHMHGLYVGAPAPVVYELLAYMQATRQVADQPYHHTAAMTATAIQEKTRMLLASGARTFPVPRGASLLSMAIALDDSAKGDLVQICLDDSHCEDVNHEGYAMQLEQGATPAHPAQQTTPLAHLATKLYPNGVTYRDTFENILQRLLYRGVDMMQMSNGRTPILLAVQACKFDSDGVVMEQRIRNVVSILQLLKFTQMHLPMSHASHSLVTEACSMEINTETTTRLLIILRNNGVNLDTPHGPSGETPLYTIVKRSLVHRTARSITQCQSIVTFLLDHGIDVHMPNTDGKTVAQLITDNIGQWSMGADVYQQFAAVFDVSDMLRREAVGHVVHSRLGGSSAMRELPVELMRGLMSREYIPLLIPPIEEVFHANGDMITHTP